MNGIMIDIETYATSNNAMMLSIGACVFNTMKSQTKDQLMEKSFYSNIDYEAEQLKQHNIVYDENTIAWWMKQEEENPDAVKVLLDNPVNIRDALLSLKDWIDQQDYDTVWANAPTFDLEIIRYHFDAFGIWCPWNFRQERCVRTTYWTAEKIFGFEPPRGFTETLHNALEDAVGQAHAVQECNKYMLQTKELTEDVPF